MYVAVLNLNPQNCVLFFAKGLIIFFEDLIQNTELQIRLPIQSDN